MSKERAVLIAVEAILAGSAAVGAILLSDGHWVPGILCLGIPATLLVTGLRTIQEERRWIIELLGKYWATKGPGLQWICPFLMNMRTFVSVWEQRYPLFEEPTKIDFIDGSAILRRAYAYVKCNEDEDRDAARKMVYAVKNAREATVAFLESDLRTYWNGLGVDEGIQLGRRGTNVLDEIKRTESGTQWYMGVEEELRSWGLRVTKVVVGDWVLDESLVEARDGVMRGQRAAEEAKFRAVQKAYEAGGTLLEVRRMLTGSPFNYPAEMAGEFAADLVKYFKAADTGRLIDFRSGAPGGGPEAIAQILAAIEATKKTLEEGERNKLR